MSFPAPVALKGTFTELNTEPVIAVYESKPLPGDIRNKLESMGVSTDVPYVLPSDPFKPKTMIARECDTLGVCVGEMRICDDTPNFVRVGIQHCTTACSKSHVYESIIGLLFIFMGFFVFFAGIHGGVVKSGYARE